MRVRAERFGVEILSAQTVTKIRVDGEYKMITTESGDEYCSRAILLAQGTRYRRLGVPGEADLIGAGIHFCATCDVPFYQAPAVVVDAEEALHVIYREKYEGPDETWQLEYVRKPQGGSWSAPTVLAKCPVPGYSHFMHSLSLGPTGTLHLPLQFHFAAGGNASQGTPTALQDCF